MNSNQKGTALVGGLLTDEVFASTDSIHTKGQFGIQRGAQQFYTPDEAAQLVRKIMGDVPTLDITAGDGSLLRYFDKPNSFGVEIDKDQIKNSDGAYWPIQGDIQHVYTLLRTSCPDFGAIVMNPPFGHQWIDPTVRDGRPTNSVVLSLIYMTRLLKDDGQFTLFCGKRQFEKQIMDRPEAAGIYAVLDVEKLFPGVNLPCVIAFGINPSIRSSASLGFQRRDFTLSQLDLASAWVLEQREQAVDRWNSVDTSKWSRQAYIDAFAAIQPEYNRRSEKRLSSQREYDAYIEGKSVRFLPSAFAQLALRKHDDFSAFNGLDKQGLNYFGQNELLWAKLRSYGDSGLIRVQPALSQYVEELLGEMTKLMIPMYPVPPQMRLGFLHGEGRLTESLTCTKTDPENDFEAGMMYRLQTKSNPVEVTVERMYQTREGNMELGKFLQLRKQLQIRVGHWTFNDAGDDASGNIQYLIDHFDLPDPGSLKEKYPEEIEALEAQVQIVLDRFMENSRKWEATEAAAGRPRVPYTHRPFQKEDIALLLFKGSGMLSWEQGLGKTLGGLLFYVCSVEILGAKPVGMIVTAKDLIDQWMRECERFLGFTPELLKPEKTFDWEPDEKTGKLKKKARMGGLHGIAHQLDKDIRTGKKTGLFITYYEALATVGTKGKNTLMPTVVVMEKEERVKVPNTGKWNYYYYLDANGDFTQEPTTLATDADGNEYAHKNTLVANGRGDRSWQVEIKGVEHRKIHRYLAPHYETKIKQITSKELCPQCMSDKRSGWNGAYCEAEDASGSTCGYSHYAVRVRPVASRLSSTFKEGVVILDEVQMIMGEFSKRSKALRGVQARHKLGMTGTPIKNFVAQAFWLLWWTLGDNSKRFGYSYDGGYAKFESDFSVIEWKLNKGKKGTRTALPEVTNLSRLWRMLSSSIIRRRKEDTGEVLVPVFHTEIEEPLGIAQAEQTHVWLKEFPQFFAEKFPDHGVVKSGMHEIMAPMLGLNHKLNFASTLPLGDPDGDWTGVMGVSNYTPANLKVLELAMALAKEGRKCLIGSDVKKTAAFIADQLCEKGVNAVHILDEDGDTVAPEERSKRVYAFQTDEVQVFCAGIKAIRLGHNLDAADAVILHGLDWSYDDMNQFVARVHRLTSQKPIDVFVILPKLKEQPTITTKKWDRLTAKGEAADLALDGRLIPKHEQEEDANKAVRELMDRGLTVTDECVDEVSVQEAWEAIPSLEYYVPKEDAIPGRPFEWERPDDSPEAREAIKAVADFLQAFGPLADKPKLRVLQGEITVKVEEDEGIFVDDPCCILCGDPSNLANALCIECQKVTNDTSATVVLSLVPDEPEETDYDIDWNEALVEDLQRFPIPGQDDIEKALRRVDISEGPHLPVVGAETSQREPDADPPEQEVEVPARPTEADFADLPILDPAVLEPSAEPPAPRQTEEAEAVLPKPDIMQQIKDANELHGMGIFTDAEFANVKAALIEKLKAA